MTGSVCIVCGSKEMLPLYRTHDRHYGIAGDFDLVRCASCGLIRLDPMPTEKQLLTYYPENYYAYLPQKQSIFWKQFLRHLLCLESKTHDPELSGAGNFLDIGCGSGTYLKLMAERDGRCRVLNLLAMGLCGYERRLRCISRITS